MSRAKLLSRDTLSTSSQNRGHVLLDEHFRTESNKTKVVRHYDTAVDVGELREVGGDEAFEGGRPVRLVGNVKHVARQEDSGWDEPAAARRFFASFQIVSASKLNLCATLSRKSPCRMTFGSKSASSVRNRRYSSLG
jgi:hypothetical protein